MFGATVSRGPRRREGREGVKERPGARFMLDF